MENETKTDKPTKAGVGRLKRMVMPDITIEDLEGLPPEVIRELSTPLAKDQRHLDIINALRKTGGTATLDHIILNLYKDTGKVFNRKTLSSKLYRMVKSNDIEQPERGLFKLKA